MGYFRFYFLVLYIRMIKARFKAVFAPKGGPVIYRTCDIILFILFQAARDDYITLTYTLIV